MLPAHLVPGYFSGSLTQSHARPEWGRAQVAALWVVAIGSGVIQDYDVVYNILSRRNYNHSTLWTHSVFPYLALAALWLVMRRAGRWPYAQLLVGLMAIGGFSHLALDVYAHGTPLFYPFSTSLVGMAPDRIVQGGLWAYLTDPLFLAEPVLFGLAAAHWIGRRTWSARARRLSFVGIGAAVVASWVTFLALMPMLRMMVGIS